MLLLALFKFNSLNAQFYTGSQLEFGKNRVKYENFFWTYYPYERYDVYFYEQGKDVANYVSKEAKKQLEDVEKLFDYSLDDRLQFIIYNKQSDYAQSNLGLFTDEPYNTGGVTRIVGSKIILFFDGDHAKLDKQIRAGITQVLIDQMMYGGNMREMLKNNTLLNLPEWYLNGLISYASSDWNTDVDNRVKDGVLSGKYKNINRLEGIDATHAGHALWRHIADNYGEAVISNIIYMTKVSRNIDNSTLFVLGISMKNLWEECYESYLTKYKDGDESKTMPQQIPIKVKKPKKPRIYGQLKVSPDGNYVLYTTNELSQQKLWLYDIQKNKTKRIYKAGHKINRVNDYSYPLVAWHPSGELFSYIVEKKGYIVMTTYELKTKYKSSRNIFDFEKVLDYAYNDDGKKFVMSGVRNGQSDIFLFTSASNANEQLTNDIYDDLHPRFVQNSKKIAFVSNRPGDTLSFDPKQKAKEPQKFKDVFLFDNITKSKLLVRGTSTPFVDESHPADYDDTYFSFLSDENGIRNRYIAKIDSVIAFVDTTEHYKNVVSYFPVTNYQRSIIEQDVNPKAQKISEVIFVNGKYQLFISPLTETKNIVPLQLKNTSYRDYKNRIENKIQIESEAKNKVLSETPTIDNVLQLKVEEVKRDSNEVDINNYVFENENKKPVKISIEEKPLTPATDTNSVKKSLVKDAEFELARQRNYHVNYSVDYVVSQLDNTFLNATYQKFTGGGGAIYLNPGINAFFKIGMSDLFEDYRIVGGMRLSGDIHNNEFFLSYEDRIKNIDKQVVLHRQSLLSATSFSLIKIYTHDARYTWKLPFSEVASVRGSIAYRNDQLIYTSTDLNNLKKPNTYENWGTARLEYVFDNTIKKGLNLYNGVRGKFFGEYYRQIDKKNTDFFVIGTDWRWYKKIHRDLIWANRIAASTSFGKQKLIYYMGGVDNWFLPRFDNSTNIATDQNYAYQTLATNMRGFYQNARNGNSFAVINSEIRFPIFKYLYKRPIRSDFVNNFQIIAFGDIGTAWTGPDPYSDKNSLNTQIIAPQGSPLVITLNTQHDPIVGGYGIGLRSRIFGYFVRLDRAWGVQDGIVLKPIWHLSFSLDF